MDFIFIAMVVAISIPALLPVIQDDPLSISHRRAVMAFAASSLLQIVFLIYIEKQTITLDYSSRFAALGVPCCILALVLKHKDITRQYKSGGIMLGAILGLVMWFFLITLH
jgi:hypothetical protein